MGARYYDAQAGRFITRDTVLDQHPYLYCQHDPVNTTDPGGHIPTWLKDIVEFCTPDTTKFAQVGFACVSGFVSGAGIIYGMEYPLPPGDRGNLIVGPGAGAVAAVGGWGLISTGMTFGGSAALGTALGGAVLVTGGVVLIGLGTIGAIWGIGHYAKWW